MQVTIADKTLDIQPIKVRELPAFVAAIEPVARKLADGDLVAALAHNADRVIEATAIGAGVDRAWLDARTPEELLELAAAVVEVNADFFVRRVLPVIQRAADRLTQSVQAVSGGTSGSSPSPAQGSATGT